MSGERPCRICFVLPSLHGGGAERAAVKILNSLDAARYDRALYLFHREGDYFRDLDPTVSLVTADTRSRVGRWRRLRDYVRKARPDVVVSFLSHFVVFAAARAARAGARVVVSQQTPLSAFLTDRDYHWRRPISRAVFEAVARRVYPRVDLIAATAQGVADDLVDRFGVARDRIAIVHNPVDLAQIRAMADAPADEEPRREPGRPFVVMTAGRLAEAKNFPLLIAALRVLAARVPLRAWILGQGDQEDAVRAHVDRAGLRDVVRLWGFQHNPWKFMARADVFVLTSHYEGFGNVLIEAMACGAPVVATSSHGTREIIQTERSGLLVERHEAGDVAAALERVLADPGLRARLSAAGRARAEDFSVPSVMRHFEAAIARAREPDGAAA